ncbi:prepilin-type N-terminal cleavage/methylation domain-containing protein [Pontiellaceae bacterium B1224]|nr:prepilin-type N-terminal cleavage/methylation domain-containing protein [Pontiellaceae bacterium B1224]
MQNHPAQPNHFSVSRSELPACRPKPWRRQAKAAFTLAELLVVIAIIGIMLAIAIPMLANISGETPLEAAAHSVHSAAKMARQHAVANKQPAYLVFHDEFTDPELAYRAYAVFTIDIHSPPVQASDGYFIKDWEILPVGVVFDPDINPSENLFNVSGAEGWEGGLNKNNLLKIEGVSAPLVVCGFKPSGEVASATHQIHLAEGAVINGQPRITVPGGGQQIHFTTLGKSRLLDTRYEDSGQLIILDEVP